MDFSEPQVTFEDQKNINLFGRLNNRLHDIDDKLRLNKEEAESLEDASNEIMLLDDTELRCMWGEVFLHMPKDSLDEELEHRKEAVQESKEQLETEKETITAKMAELKKVLYGKFKDSINLEEDA